MTDDKKFISAIVDGIFNCDKESKPSIGEQNRKHLLEVLDEMREAITPELGNPNNSEVRSRLVELAVYLENYFITYETEVVDKYENKNREADLLEVLVKNSSKFIEYATNKYGAPSNEVIKSISQIALEKTNSKKFNNEREVLEYMFNTILELWILSVR